MLNFRSERIVVNLAEQTSAEIGIICYTAFYLPENARQKAVTRKIVTWV